MTRNEIVKLAAKLLLEIQDISGREKISINEETVPIGDLLGFDSLSGVEFAAMVDAEVNIGDVGNLCASQDGTRALSVGEIADRILEATSKKRKKS